MTDTTARVVHFYDWENCELACDATGVDTSDPIVAETEDRDRINCPDCLARLAAMDKFLAEGNEIEQTIARIPRDEQLGDVAKLIESARNARTDVDALKFAEKARELADALREGSSVDVPERDTDETWRGCAHRADYTSAAHHERECAYHRGEVDEWGVPIVTPATAVFRNDAAESAEHTILSPEQALWIAQTIAWNVDLETVRVDNGDVERADFLAAFADRILGKPRG